MHFVPKFIDAETKQHLITKFLVRKLSGEFKSGILIFTGEVIGRLFSSIDKMKDKGSVYATVPSQAS